MINIIGVDPGPASGITTLHWSHDPGEPKPVIIWRAYQCNAGSARSLLELILHTWEGEWAGGQIEHFVPSNLPGSPTTVRLENELAEAAADQGVPLMRKPMASVKTWASDRRMTAARAWAAIPAKMVDARAAGKHGLYCAVSGGHIPDPLSKAGRLA
jgi:hypothetical protein